MTDIEVETSMNYIAANFSRRLQTDGKGEYRKFLRSVVDEDIVKKVIDNYAAKELLPTLYQLRKSYKEALQAKNPTIEPEAKKGCVRCNYSGILNILFIGYSMDKKLIAVKAKPMNFPWMYEQKIPCECERGNYFRANSHHLSGLSNEGHAKILKHCAFDNYNELKTYYEESRKLKPLQPDDKESIRFLSKGIEAEEEQQEMDIF